MDKVMTLRQHEESLRTVLRSVREYVEKNCLSGESDPTVPPWAKESQKPSYTASEVGALPNTQSSGIIAYPVGALYLSASEASPAALFGGEWEKLEGRFLLAADALHPGGSTGGEEEHTLTVEELPSHRHEFNENLGWNASGGSYAIFHTSGKTSTSASWLRTAYEGGDAPHNNMPPYLAVHVWKRIR